MSDTRIYVSVLADYNNGRPHGAWIDIDGDMDREALDQQIAKILRESKYPNVRVTCPDCEEDAGLVISCMTCHGEGKVPSAEEWIASDYDGIPSEFGECADLDDVLEFVQGVEEHGDAFRAWVEHLGITNFIHEDFDDKCAGEATSEEAWIDRYLDDNGLLSDVPENLRMYFDSEAYLRDMKLNGDVAFVEVDGNHYAFWNH